METIFEYLTQEQQNAGEDSFEALAENWDLRTMTLEEAFKIGFARGAGVVVPDEVPNEQK